MTNANATGNYSITIASENDTATTSVRILNETADGTGTPEPVEAPGFGPIVALVAVLFVALRVRQRD